MAKIVEYDEKFTSAKTVYADIDQLEKTMMLDSIHQAFMQALEDANYKMNVRKALLEPYADFRKHIASGDPKLNNSLQSFLSGLMRQHYNKPNKDLSTKMLKGLSIASAVLEHLGYPTEEYVFTKRANPRQGTTPFEKLFH